MNSKLLSDRVAYITGAAEGIGLAIAELFVREGAKVALADLNYAKAQTEAERLNAEYPESAFAVACDVASMSEVEQSIRAVHERWGRLDILINNAAIALGGDIDQMDEAAWQKVINTNLNSAYRTIHHALPIMKGQGSGCIINMASTQAHRCWAGWTAYAAAKGGLLAMTNQLAGQFAPVGIRVNAISPGAIDTPMNATRIANEGAQLRQKLADMHAMERWGTSAEVAQVALFLASDASSFVTGQDIKVDGGLCTLPRYFENV